MRYARYLRFLPLFLLCTLFAGTSNAKEWRGLIPGVSTRADVVRLFDQCHDRNASCEFDFEGDRIRVVLSTSVQNEFYPCTKSLAQDTVLLIEVTPSRRVSLRKVDLKELKVLGSTPEFRIYINERTGVVTKTHKGKVIELNYLAEGSAKDRCVDYYDTPIKFAQVITHCPPVTVLGATERVAAGEIITLQADVTRDPKMTLIWLLSAGRITSQNGRSISVATAGLAGQTLKVTVQALGSCSVENSVQIRIE